jgi:hypothetical protein
MRRLAAALMGLGCVLLLLGAASLGIELYGYGAVVLHARQALLEDHRDEIRGAVQAYRQDRGKSPATLKDLVEAGYLKCLPRAGEADCECGSPLVS